jgi:Tol biopolymer transport system component
MGAFCRSAGAGIVSRPGRIGALRRAPRILRVLHVALVVALALMTLLAGAAHGQLEPNDTGQQTMGLIGTIAAPHGSGVLLMNVATRAEHTIDVTPAVGVSGHTAWSPDRTRLAISRFGRRSDERVGGSDILVVPAEGGEASAVAEHDADGALLGAPAWLPDGTGLFYDRLPPAGGALQSEILFASLPGSTTSRPIIAGGWPTISPDGRLMAYVRPSRQDEFLNELVLTDIAGISERVLVPANDLVQITSPRFSPDGQEIAFIGSVSRGEAMRPLGPRNAVLGGDLFAKGVMNHGPPGDVWVIGKNGGQAYRLTTFEEDEPTLAWSPDGYWLAMLGGGGLYLLPRDMSRPPQMIAKGGFGGIDWR